MKCEECKELLWFYIEETLTAEEEKQVADHIEHCASCKMQLEEIKETKNMLKSLPEVELPAGYHETLMEKLEAEQATTKETKVISLAKRKKDKFQWKNMGLIAAAVCLVVVGGTKMNFFNMGADSASSTAAPMAVAESRMMDEAVAEESATEEMELAAGSSASTTAGMDDMAVSTTSEQESALPYQEMWEVSVVDMEAFVADLGDLLVEADGMITMVDIDAVEVSLPAENRDAFLALLEQKMAVAIIMEETTENKEIFIRIGCNT